MPGRAPTADDFLPALSPWGTIIEAMFKVLTKGPPREVVPFVLNPEQRKLDAEITGRDIVPKARQLGVSTYGIARSVAQCITLEHQRHALVSHEDDATKRLLAFARFLLENMQSPGHGVEIDVATGKLTEAHIVFKDTNSWFYIGTAGSKAFGRGDTLTRLHGSEVAYWPETATAMLAGIISSMAPGSEILLESTGNGVGNNYERRVQQAVASTSPWRVHFFPWIGRAEYERSLSRAEQRQFEDDLAAQRTDYEARGRKGEPPAEVHLADDLNVSLEQLAWRRDKLADLANDERMFKQEFPATLDECFQGTGGSVFTNLTWRPTTAWRERLWVGGGEALLDGHPRAGQTYVLGVDVAGGLKFSESDDRDRSVIQVGWVEGGEQVGCWWGGRTDPSALAPVIEEWSNRFNGAFVVPEANNHGLTTIDSLRKRGFPMGRVYQRLKPGRKQVEQGLMQYGHLTSAKTKPLAVGRLKALLQEHGYILHCPRTRLELLAFVETPEGRLEGQEGTHDDFVMAMAMLAVGWPKGLLEAGSKAQEEERKPARRPDVLDMDQLLRGSAGSPPPMRGPDSAGGGFAAGVSFYI